MKNNRKVYLIIVLILVIVFIISILAITRIKRENVEYGGIDFNKEMNINNIDLVLSSDETQIQVPVPKGYVASSVESERTVNGGFVIYEGEEKVTEANLEQAKRTRNQYVWIPIEDASDMYHMSDNKIYGAYYEFTSTRYTRKIRAYEPNIVGFDKEETNLLTYLNGISKNDFLKEMEQSFYEMIESVGRYGGFYIGRYETGNLSKNEPVVVKMNEDIANQNWYNMYKKSKRVSGTNNKVEINIIWGIQFDETLKWLIDTGCKTYTEVATNSTSWGNYNNATFQYTNTSGGTSTKAIYTNTRIPTGSSEYTKANNIYDLAGNVWDWTMEGDGSGSRLIRGSVYYITGMDFPTHYRGNDVPIGLDTDRRFTSSTLH